MHKENSIKQAITKLSGLIGKNYQPFLWKRMNLREY